MAALRLRLPRRTVPLTLTPTLTLTLTLTVTVTLTVTLTLTRCHGCGCSPECWSCVELYSEHYRAAARNGLTITRRAVELGTLRVGAPLRHAESWPASGFMQCPTLPRLPPGWG